MTAITMVLALQGEPVVESAQVTCDRWPSNYDAKSWIADVYRIENAKADEEKVIALYKWVRLLLHWGEQCGDGTRGTSVVECDAIKKINIYPFGECSDFGVTSAALGHAGGLRAMEAHVPGHVELEVAYKDKDGVERAHRLDPFWGITVYDRTASHIATWQEIRADRSIALEPSKTIGPWGDKASDRERFADKGSAKPSLRVRPSVATMTKSLGPGEIYTLRWERDDKVPFYNNHPDPSYRGGQELGGAPRFQYADGKVENLKYGHELLLPYLEVGKHGLQVSWGHGELVLKTEPGAGAVRAVECPYVIVDARCVRKEGPVSIAYADWRQRDYTVDQVWPAQPTWLPVSGAELPVRGEYRYLFRCEGSAEIRHAFQLNPLALPRLLPGKNVITVTAGSIRPEYRLKVVYRWDDASGRDHEDAKLVDRFPSRYEIVAAGAKPADVRTRSLTLEAMRKGP